MIYKRKIIKGFPGYKIDSCGNVWSCRKRGRPGKKNLKTYNRWRKLKPQTTTKGYKFIDLINEQGNKKMCLIHRLLAIAFIPNPDNKPQINHKNLIKDDNRLENLEWCTRSENIRHYHYKTFWEEFGINY